MIWFIIILWFVCGLVFGLLTFYFTIYDVSDGITVADISAIIVCCVLGYFSICVFLIFVFIKNMDVVVYKKRN